MSVVIDKLFDPSGAFEHPVVVWVLGAIGIVLLLVPVLIEVLGMTGRLDRANRTELYTRYLAWLVMIPLIVGPVLLGPGCAIIAICVLSLACYREFARATGFFRNRVISATVALGILITSFAVYDHWYNFFVALTSMTIAAIAFAALLRDEPKGYLQRVSLGCFSFLLFGVCLGHLAYMANDHDYRPIIILILLCVEANDVFAYVTGKTFGSRKLASKTSPNKTLGGSIGALILTTGLFVVVGHFVFRGSILDSPVHLIAMGCLLSVVGQIGDLVVSSVKRDLGIKDMGIVIPGHGGLLDRFDSLIFVAPALFHYIGYFRGFGLDGPVRIITGGGGG